MRDPSGLAATSRRQVISRRFQVAAKGDSMRKSLCLAIAGIALTAVSNAGYDANMSGTLVSVLTYTHTDSVYFRLVNQPGAHPFCNPNYFVIGPEVSGDRRKALLARLLTAYATGESVNVGYDSTSSDCSDGYIRPYRVG
jgi:hypothetical protein